MKVFVTRKIPENGLKLLTEADFEVKVSPLDRPLTPDELKQEVAGMDAILSQLVDKITDEVIDAAGKQLKIIANYAVGFDNINVSYAHTRNILVTNTPEVPTEAVADHAFALLLACAHRIAEGDRFARAGKYKGWQPFLLLGQDLYGKTLGIVGLGRIGSAVARRGAKGFGMKILYYDPVVKTSPLDQELGAQSVSLEAILKQSDYISVHVPLTPQTKHLISTKQFEMMKKSSVLVNTSRGPVVDEAALLEALRKNDIFGAGIDVWEFEPNLTPGLEQQENIVITPHTASATVEARQAMSRVAAENVIAALKGQTPPNLVKLN